MANNGLLVTLNSCMSNCSVKDFEHIVWCLCNLISENQEIKMMVYEIGMYYQLISLFEKFKHSQDIRKIFAWFISNSMRCTPDLDANLVG